MKARHFKVKASPQYLINDYLGRRHFTGGYMSHTGLGQTQTVPGFTMIKPFMQLSWSNEVKSAVFIIGVLDDVL